MIFNPKMTEKKEGRFILPKNANAVAHPCLDKSVIHEFWHNFTFNASILSLSHSEELIFRIGNTPKAELEEFDYSINIDSDGVCVYAKSEKDLICGFMTLLDRIRADDPGEATVAILDCEVIKDFPTIKNRMVHFCVFPETEIWEIQRFVRFCGALKYTHVVLEFWGMLKYDCMRELAWQSAFTKEQIRPIIKEANDLGLEIIPMFNHWGHAAASRVRHGKHVVLDQNLSLQTYFSPDGWCWDIKKQKVRDLLRRIRNELIELCGDGGYFHIGCDEAYNFKFTKDNMEMICDFINEIGEDLRAQGRRVIAWGDMFLYRRQNYNPNNRYTCNAPDEEAVQYMLSRLDRNIIIADWQYDATEAPVETAAVFANAGFDCLLCPWDRGNKNMRAMISTAKDQALMGIMHTTWHTLSIGMPFVTCAAVGSFDSFKVIEGTYTAALYRKVMFVDGDYTKAGWSKKQIDSIC